MNLEDAVIAHSEWKRTLTSYISKPDHSLKVSEVAADDKCKLGQWIAGEGRKYASLPEFAKLRAEHTRFHRAAADVVRRAVAGQPVSSEVAVGAGSEFGKASAGIVLAIMDMKKKA
jgi:methyl-accepting chemotaxis protein